MIDLSSHPEKVTTFNSEEHEEMCLRAVRGEFSIHAINQGKTNAECEFEIYWPVAEQENLL